MVEPKVYKNGFNCWGDVTNSFRISKEEPPLVYAQHDLEGFENFSAVIYFEDGQWYYAYGWPCSNCDLANQWKPFPFKPDEWLDTAKKQGSIWHPFYDWLTSVLAIPD